MATIRDIARHAQVSVSTVSLALNDGRRVRPETRERVLDAVRQLDYRPSRSARSLSSGLTYSLHLLDPAGGEALTSGFFTRFVRGLHDAAMERSYTVAFTIVSGEGEAAAHVETLIRERWTDGVVLLNPSDGSALLELMAARDFPHVVLGRDPEALAPSVDNDNQRVGHDAARYLAQRGRRRLAFVNGTAAQTFARDRGQGFEAGSRAAGVAGEVLYGDGTPEAAGHEAVAAAARGIDGIVTASDTQAVAALRALRSAGVRVPDEVALLGMNNDAIGEYVDPPLTSVDLGAARLGSEAAHLLLDRIAEPQLGPVRRLVPHELVVRGSA